MNGMQYLAVVLLVAGSLGLVGYSGNTAAAQPEAVGCSDPAMMDDPMMDSVMDDMMLHASDGQSLSTQAADIQARFVAVWGECAAARWVEEHEADMPMMDHMMLQARDGQSLSTQAADIQARYVAVWGDRAAARWVEEHEAELTMMDNMMH